MPRLVAYHRPSTPGEAASLLGGPGRMALAGGTTVRHDVGGEAVELVDLQALGLSSIDVDDGRWVLGAMVCLDQLVDEQDLPELVRWAARAELPSTLRTLATVGGTIGAAEPESVLLAALLAHEAIVRFADDSSRPLADVLEAGLGAADLVVAVELDGSGRSARATTGRTPADTPIVAVLGRSTVDGALRLALTGVAPTPVLADADRIDALDPPGDFRGSSGYRRHLAAVLAARVRGELA
jgi:CO/xanthine dehydrogenase FAD-binding subunit